MNMYSRLTQDQATTKCIKLDESNNIEKSEVKAGGKMDELSYQHHTCTEFNPIRLGLIFTKYFLLSFVCIKLFRKITTIKFFTFSYVTIVITQLTVTLLFGFSICKRCSHNIVLYINFGFTSRYLIPVIRS